VDALWCSLGQPLLLPQLQLPQSLLLLLLVLLLPPWFF
jgi:hypothetical protein